MKRSLILTVFSLLVLAQISSAQVPQTFSYQGVLRDKTTGELVDGTKYATFSIYDSEGATSDVWTSGLQSITVTNGIFHVKLGSATKPLPDPFPSQAWLGIKVDPDTEEMPRIELTSAPYSLKADQASQVTGATNVFPGDGNVGIGTLSPASKLTVDGLIEASGAGGGFKFPDATIQTSAAVGDDHSLNAAEGGPTDVVYVDKVGSVGIGTVEPAYQLDVSGDARITGDITLEGQDLIFAGVAGSYTSSDSWLRRNPSFGFIEIKPNNTNYGLYLRALSGTDYANFETQSGYLTIGHNTGDGPLYITNANVGIGTAPIRPLDVVGSSATDYIARIENQDAAGGGLAVHVADTSSSGNALNVTLGTATGLVVDSHGQVGIGTATPYSTLDVRGSIPNYVGYFHNNNSTGGAYGLYSKAYAYDSSIDDAYGGYFTAFGGNMGGLAYGLQVNAQSYGTAAAYGGQFTAYGGSSGGAGYGLQVYSYAYGSQPSYGIWVDATSGTTDDREWALYGLGDGYFSGEVGIGTISPTASLEVVGVVKADTLQLATAAERWYAIPGRGFAPIQGSAAYNDTLSYIPYISGSWGPVKFSAGVHLPHGAVITQLLARVEDSHALGDTSNFLIDLWEVADTGSPTSIASVSTSGAPGAVPIEYSGFTHTVDNQNNTYLVSAEWKTPGWPDDGAALKLYSVRIKYTVDQPLP